MIVSAYVAAAVVAGAVAIADRVRELMKGGDHEKSNRRKHVPRHHRLG
jgi:hypothetical protein